MNYKRIMAMGDIHGEWDKFMSLYNKVKFNADEDLLIFLGDYIDRGKKPLQVLDWMYEHKDEKNIIMLRGNHEQMMLDYYNSKGCNKTWLWNGGDTSRRLLGKQRLGILDACLSFLENLPLYHRMEINGQEIVFCHAGLVPGIPLEQQDKYDLLWIRDEFYNVYDGESLIVIGHTPVETLGLEAYPTRYQGKNILMVDTGSFMKEGCISCIDILSGTFWQSDVA